MNFLPYVETPEIIEESESEEEIEKEILIESDIFDNEPKPPQEPKYEDKKIEDNPPIIRSPYKPRKKKANKKIDMIFEDIVESDDEEVPEFKLKKPVKIVNNINIKNIEEIPILKKKEVEAPKLKPIQPIQNNKIDEDMLERVASLAVQKYKDEQLKNQKPKRKSRKKIIKPETESDSESESDSEYEPEPEKKVKKNKQPKQQKQPDNNYLNKSVFDIYKKQYNPF